MKNVYEQVQQYYDEYELDDSAVAQSWIEGFLRQKAWSGADEDTLLSYWNELALLLLYMMDRDVEQIELIEYDEYHQMVYYLHDMTEDFPLTLVRIRSFFSVVQAFYRYLLQKNLIKNTAPLEAAVHFITEGNQLQLLDRSYFDETEVVEESTNLSSADFIQEVTSTIESLMEKLGSFFHRKEFMKDFERALFLYTGPFETVPTKEADDFWLGFWDYFLFDYHLLENDYVPLAYFSQIHQQELGKEEIHLLEELMKTQYTVFYIQRILDDNFVECVNLLTDEVFRLPQPDFDYKKVKRLLFFGHVFTGEMTLVNYVTSLEVSPNLRQRIKQEVALQKQIFEIKQPDAKWSDFLARHALNIKYTVDILVSLCKVHVTPFEKLNVVKAEPAEAEVASGVTEAIKNIFQQHDYSSYDIKLGCQLWSDYAELQKPKLRNPMLWAAAVFLVYSQVNGQQETSAHALANELDLSTQSLYVTRAKLESALTLEPFDPRYLSEEGFIFMLLQS